MDIFKGAQFSDYKIDQDYIFSSFLFRKKKKYISWPFQIVYCPVVRGLPWHQGDKSGY